ncbi:hypothetical protein BJ322DRAFT_1048322 [Thelephora terrestris]|uniref:Uncharacterized protein n=1 Tax=Thelephora terrestris TaxID=56493 RepID=A0A9P6L9T6_9AGAM|nr:hypothetical protein BJ322DRAFT_1048322 [Thelephora terrestris]
METSHRPERTELQITACHKSKGLPSLPEEDESCVRRSNFFRSDILFDESLFTSPPRRAPQPPQRSVSGDIKLRLAGKSFDFPCPPLDKESAVSLTRSPATRVVPMRFRKRPHSPTSSISSAASSASSDDTVGQTLLTPNTSDDEHIPASLSVTAPNSKRLSVLFIKSMPDLRPPSPKIATVEEMSEEDGEEAEWLTQEMQDFVTLSLPPIGPDEGLSSRPESFLPPPRISNAFKALPSVVSPSAQLDPTFHYCQKKSRSFIIPSRPPPPPPIRVCPASPLNNVFAVSSPCPSTTTIPLSNRPPPRSSIPCDVDELMQMDMDDFDLLEDELIEARDAYLDSPFDSIFNAYQHSPTVPIGFGVNDLPTTPSSFAFSDDSHHSDLPQTPLRRSASSVSTASSATRRLRSKWSTSTLGSMYNDQSQSSSWMSKFSFKKGSNKEKAVPSTPTSTSPPRSAKKDKRRKFTGADIVVRRSYESDVSQVERRDSRGSRNSSESAESSPSPGLRRKPIPVEIFMKQ